MADPRNTTSMEGIGYHGTTYSGDSTIVYDGTLPGGAAATMIGKAVTITGAKQVGLCADGDPIVGKLIQVESDGKCTVQDDGFTTLPAGNGATVTADKRFVGALGAASAKGYIRNATAGDEINAGDGIIVDASTTTAVLVEL